MSDTFKCEACEQTFDKGQTDEEAVAELGEKFPDFGVEDCGVVCDDCFKAMFPEPKPISPELQALLDAVTASPEWQAAMKAVENNILYGTPLPN